jgi:hypothetical protein
MSISLSSTRRLAVGAVGAGAVAGALLFGAIPAANAASSVAAPAVGGVHDVSPVFWGHHHHDHHHHTHRHGGLHIGGLIA